METEECFISIQSLCNCKTSINMLQCISRKGLLLCPKLYKDMLYIILSFDVFRIWTLQDKMLTKCWKEERKSPILKKEQVLYFLWYFPPNFNLPIRFDNCGHLITKNPRVLPVLVSFSLQYWSLFFPVFFPFSQIFDHCPPPSFLLMQFTLNCFNRNYFGHWFIKFPTLNVWFCLFLRSL